jgi:hypothetical protein
MFRAAHPIHASLDAMTLVRTRPKIHITSAPSFTGFHRLQSPGNQKEAGQTSGRGAEFDLSEGGSVGVLWVFSVGGRAGRLGIGRGRRLGVFCEAVSASAQDNAQVRGNSPELESSELESLESSELSDELPVVVAEEPLLVLEAPAPPVAVAGKK